MFNTKDTEDAPVMLDILLSDIGLSDLHEKFSIKFNKKYLSDIT